MSQSIPAPDSQTLLPPLLACLPTSFASSKPPPVFLSLVSPILRQRLHIHTTTSSAHESWLRLLCWDAVKAETLKETIENANFEPHPSSGELEVGETEPTTYKRFDFETLKAQIPLADWSLTAMYLWCSGSGDENSGWKLAELLPYDSELSRSPSWSSTIAAANEKNNLETQTATVQASQINGGQLSVPGQDEDEDDDYWAQYDKSPANRTPSRTPARKASMNPAGSANSDGDYYAAYGDVQPAADNYDPDEHHEEIGQSTLNGDNLQKMLSQQSVNNTSTWSTDHNFAASVPSEDHTNVLHPVPASPSSAAGSDMVAKLEKTAEKYSASEIAIKQHISTSVKSMYRLAKGAGMSRREFEDMVQRELETLSIFDRDD